MKWSAALKWAIPAWLLVCAVTVAINYAAEARLALLDLVVALLAAFPLTAFIIKATSEDVAKWRAAYGSRDDKSERH